MYKALRRGTTEVAVKQLNSKLDDISLRVLYKEIRILQKVSHHPSIVRYYGANLNDPAIICMEYMKVGSLEMISSFLLRC